MKIFILATCRRPDLARMTTLVFETLRVGFPTADVIVDVNGSAFEHCPELTNVCQQTRCEVRNVDTIHPEWIEHLVRVETAPFWVCDTDVVFYDNIETWTFDKALAGRRTPEWLDEFSGALTRARLHTSLLHIDPQAVLAAITAYQARLPGNFFVPPVNLFQPLCMPLRGEPTFYDTCSLLYHAIGGHAFTSKELDAFFHFNFGTISDLVLPRLTNADQMVAARDYVLADPQRGRGMWRAQDEYYAGRQPKRFNERSP